MENTLRLLPTIVSALAMLFSVASCRNDKPELTITEATHFETVNKEQSLTASRYGEAAFSENNLGCNFCEISINEIARFTPLNDNERFAFSTQTIHDENFRSHNRLTFFAIRNNDISDVTELFTWEPILRWDIQLTNDLKKAFFIQTTPDFMRRESERINHLYMANGITGEIRRLPADIGHDSMRVSKDGRFVLFQKNVFGAGYVTIFLLCVENEALVREYAWKPNVPRDLSGISAWNIRRFDNVFRIYASGESGFIYAAAELDLSTMKLETQWEWDGTEAFEVDFSVLPNVSFLDGEFAWGWRVFDDVNLQDGNPYIRLQGDTRGQQPSKFAAL